MMVIEIGELLRGYDTRIEALATVESSQMEKDPSKHRGGNVAGYA